MSNIYVQERSIQPLVSLAYSKAADDWKNACNAMANLALKEEFQFKIVQARAHVNSTGVPCS